MHAVISTVSLCVLYTYYEVSCPSLVSVDVSGPYVSEYSALTCHDDRNIRSF